MLSITLLNSLKTLIKKTIINKVADLSIIIFKYRLIFTLTFKNKCMTYHLNSHF